MYEVFHEISSLSRELLERYKTNVFFETGSNTGKGIDLAASVGYNKIISLDIEKKFVDICKEKFKSNPTVDVRLADSATDLFNIIKKIDEKITFWLDGHSFYSVPLIKELQQIQKHHIKDHVILIDDVRMFGNPLWNELSKEETIQEIYKINKNYKIVYADSPNGPKDILIAYIE
jgi:hypothetical protein